MKLLILLSTLLINNSYSYEMEDLYYFPSKSKSSLELQISLKEFEIEYDEASIDLGGNDIQEFDQQVLTTRIDYKYSFTDNLLIVLGFDYQGNDLDTNFEDKDDNSVPTSSDNGLYDPSLELRYRFVEMDEVFLDGYIKNIFKTNSYIEGNRSRTAKTYSGQNTSRIATTLGYKFSAIQLSTRLSIDFLSSIEKKLVLFNEVFTSDYTYSVSFGGTVLFRFNKDWNLSLGFDTASIEPYNLKSSTRTVHVDQMLSALFLFKTNYKKFSSSIGILSLSFAVDTIFNRLTLNSTSDIKSESQSLITTLGIEKRF